MRRFYKSVDVGRDDDDAYTILLDGKLVKTTQRTVLSVAEEALAKQIVAEWEAQGETIIPATMPLTALASTALDRVEPNRSAIIDAIMAFAASDLLCYRSDDFEVASEQTSVFDPLLERFERRTGKSLKVVRGIMPIRQENDTIALLRTIVEQMSTEELTAFQAAAALSSSFILSLLFIEGELTAQTMFAAAYLDELYQIRRWGEDDEERRRLDAALRELQAIETYLRPI